MWFTIIHCLKWHTFSIKSPFFFYDNSTSSTLTVLLWSKLKSLLLLPSSGDFVNYTLVLGYGSNASSAAQIHSELKLVCENTALTVTCPRAWNRKWVVWNSAVYTFWCKILFFFMFHVSCFKTMLYQCNTDILDLFNFEGVIIVTSSLSRILPVQPCLPWDTVYKM